MLILIVLPDENVRRVRYSTEQIEIFQWFSCSILIFTVSKLLFVENSIESLLNFFPLFCFDVWDLRKTLSNWTCRLSILNELTQMIVFFCDYFWIVSIFVLLPVRRRRRRPDWEKSLVVFWKDLLVDCFV